MLERHAAGDALPSILSEVLAALALRPDAGERLTVTGAENLPSCFPVTALATAAIGAAGLAVSELLGHAGTQITAEVYAHLTTPTARKAMDTLGDSLGL